MCIKSGATCSRWGELVRIASEDYSVEWQRMDGWTDQLTDMTRGHDNPGTDTGTFSLVRVRENTQVMS